MTSQLSIPDDWEVTAERLLLGKVEVGIYITTSLLARTLLPELTVPALYSASSNWVEPAAPAGHSGSLLLCIALSTSGKAL